MANPVVHFEIGGRDREKSSAFYSELFGWNTADYGPFSKQVDTGSETGVQGYLTALGHEPHNYVTVYVEVDDVAEHLPKVTQLGGQIVVPATEIPGGGHFAWIQDIDGNIIGLIQKQAS